MKTHPPLGLWWSYDDGLHHIYEILRTAHADRALCGAPIAYSRGQGCLEWGDGSDCRACMAVLAEKEAA